MIGLTLLTKVRGVNQLNEIGDALKLSLKGLHVETKIKGTTANGWAKVALSGEDEDIAANYIAKEIGLCPASFENLGKFSTLKGYVSNFENNKQELKVDVGVFQPKPVHAILPLDYLQAQLVDGRKTTLKKLGELYGFCENLPLFIKVVGVSRKGSRIDAELSTKQLTKYVIWQGALLDKLVILGVSLRKLQYALKNARLNRDVINVETLGIFDQVLTCKLGTDAAGLIPKIGRILKNSKFAVFNPRRIKAFLEKQPEFQ